MHNQNATVHILIDGEYAKVFSPFAVKDLVKSTPGARWVAAEKAWIIHAAYVPSLQTALTRARYWVDITRTEKKTSRTPQPPTGRASSGTWADDMFATLPAALGEKAFRALSRVLHPDAGGSTEAMQVLNVAHDRAKALR